MRFVIDLVPMSAARGLTARGVRAMTLEVEAVSEVAAREAAIAAVRQDFGFTIAVRAWSGNEAGMKRDD